ncbi:Swt1 family HEPN domain-containing protein [Thalassoroseus pseudoceratinae]|uniref:Swt1 family HEPN domain-containing protein n=1 Tax=Thalassoroseus pseudoceratinae TaxID=2713176 RepID=UPI0014217677|nr:Swt1 family HEPN domain-containing protein [Thalassoroseus pseudoceratinae]
MRVYREQVTQALDQLSDGLGPYIESKLKTIYKDRWVKVARESFRSGRGKSGDDGDTIDWDAHATLTVMWDQWNSLFRHDLAQTDRSLVSELREFRNLWAHQTDFDFDDTYRVLDSVERLLNSIGAKEAEDVADIKLRVFRAEFDQQVRAVYQRSEARRRNLLDISIYSACCAAILYAIFEGYGSKAWFMMICVVMVFAVIIWQRVSTPPILFGAHECLDCGRIIYTDQCPYCARTAPRPRTRPQDQPNMSVEDQA